MSSYPYRSSKDARPYPSLLGQHVVLSLPVASLANWPTGQLVN
jgi:hypothetical protein